MTSINVAEIAVMHDGYRLPPEEMRELLTAVELGVVFDRDVLRAHESEGERPIAIVRFPDNRLFIRDGLHRTTAIMLMRPSQAVMPDEFMMQHMTYEMFQRPNLDVGFYTPFDPLTEVRAADWSEFRTAVEHRISRSLDPTDFIAKHKEMYLRPRSPHHDSLRTFFDHHRTKYAGILP